MKLFNVVYLVTLLLVNSLAEPKGLDKTQQLDKSERCEYQYLNTSESYIKVFILNWQQKFPRVHLAVTQKTG